ncbi:MAG: hypothetical protein Tsb005_18770 [Gammaproteobacteria bacterium]
MEKIIVSNNNYIELNRTFYEISKDYTHNADDDLDLSEFVALKTGDEISWQELLEKRRIVLLAEAGSGKTTEIKHAAINLRDDDKFAFFLRLENIPDNFEDSFEIGTFDEFNQWLKSGEEGWLFLDSIDEARLRDPRNFESAIKRVSKFINAALDRVHIILTGRVNAWRSQTDLALCTEYLLDNKSENKKIPETGDNKFPPDEPLSNKAESTSTTVPNIIPFEFYTLADLSNQQVENFLESKNVNEVPQLLGEIERQNAQNYISRPQDLEELVEYWNNCKKIGSPLELIRNSVENKSKERDQNRAELTSIPQKKVDDAVKVLAAATIFMQNPNIRVPDGSHNNLIGIDAGSLLSGWLPQEITALLGRPIFVEGPYGTVRFHHRSASEFLTAEYLWDLLQNGASRLRIERLFFREQYGREVVIPSRRPVLVWVIIFDQPLRDKVCNIEPEIMFEGGDPSQLPSDTRVTILNTVCKKMASHIGQYLMSNYPTIKNFASPDISRGITTLLGTYKNNPDIAHFLINMIWQGRINANLPEAQDFALDDTIKNNTRIIAIKIVKEMGSEQDFQAVLESLLLQTSVIDSSILAEIINYLDSSEKSIKWIFNALEKTDDIGQYDFNGLKCSLVKFAERLVPEVTITFIRYVNYLLNKEPFIEKPFGEISKRFAWLLDCGARSLGKLIIACHSAALNDESLSILAKIPVFDMDPDFDINLSTTNIYGLVKQWPELNYRLLWKEVERMRQRQFFQPSERLTNFTQVFTIQPYLSFEADEFDRAKEEIRKKELLDDKLVALSLALHIFVTNGKPGEWLTQLEQLSKDQEELQVKLVTFLNPPAPSQEQIRSEEQQAKRDQQVAERREKQQRCHSDWLEWLNSNWEKLQDERLLKELFEDGKVLNAQYYLLNYLREHKDDRTHWAQENWQDLRAHFGEKIATAFRNGLLLAWKYYTPKLRSENNNENGTPIAVIIGLSGLAIEAKETGNWPDKLSEEDASLACRYAFQELNEFPSWFPKLYQRFPQVVIDLVLNELYWELATYQHNQEQYYIIEKISWKNSQPLWDDLAPELLKRLEAEPLSLKYLGYFLKIILSSSVILDQEIAQIAEVKCTTLHDIEPLAQWFAAWIGVAPEGAIKKLTEQLGSIENQADASCLAMNVIVNLTNNNSIGSHARAAYKTPQHLKTLYLLMRQYIKEEEDIVRPHMEAYTPELRDDAQRARGWLLSILKDMPGKETYLALMELSENHSNEWFRAWMLQNAKQRAEHDAEEPAWSNEQFLEYKQEQECTPKNHKELSNFAVQRLLDLKHELEEGDTSIASILKVVKEETAIRNCIGGKLRDHANGRYSIPQEEELADARRPDLRMHGVGFDAPVPVELKLADNWSASQLFERLENQLCGDYLRDNRSNTGIFLLVYRGKKGSWEIPGGNQQADFNQLIAALQNHWKAISPRFPQVEQISVIGIDLTKRQQSKSKT